MHGALVILATLLPAQADQNLSVAVMPLASNSVEPNTVAILDNLLVSAFPEYCSYRVIGTGEINAILGFEKMKEAAGCDDLSCAAEIGGALGVDLLFVGNVDILGDQILFTASLLSVQTAEAKGRARMQAPNDENAYFGAVDQLVAQLFNQRPRPPAPPGSAVQRSKTPDPEPRVAEERSIHLGFRYMYRFIGWESPTCADTIEDPDCFSDAGPIHNAVVEFRWQHHEMLALQARTGLSWVFVPEPDDSDARPMAFIIGVFEQFIIPFFHEPAPDTVVSNTPLAFTAALGAELTLGAGPVLGRAGAELGFQLWWFTANAFIGGHFGGDVEGDPTRNIENRSPVALAWGLSGGLTFAF